MRSIFVQSILSNLDRDREREIIARRFGLFDRKETLEQIGELLGRFTMHRMGHFRE